MVAAASASPIEFDAQQDHRSGSDFERVAGELVHAPSRGNAGALAGGSELAFDFAGGLLTPTFGDRSNDPPIEMLRFTFDLTDSNPPVSDANSASFPAIGRSPSLDQGDRFDRVVIPLPSGGLLAIAGLGLIGARRTRSVS
ncbi:MAG: hypothetical protein EA423_01740 [Phycisphaerales bacterium]|nr:MAG: hypothetical protein EA423_01740 [Phycisphaerales bacterium]